MKKILYIMILIALLLLIYSFKNRTNNNAQEQYVILKKLDNIEIREYSESTSTKTLGN